MMRFACLSLGLLLILPPIYAQSTDLAPGATATQPDGPQQTVTQPSTGSTLLQQSLAVLTGSTSVNDVTLNGTITITSPSAPSSSSAKAGGTPGINTESGTITLTAVGDAESQVVINTPSGTRTEIRNISSGQPVEKWTGTDGIAHYNRVDSLLTPHAAWFFPTFMLAAESSSANQASNADLEIRNGATVQHVSVLQIPSTSVAAPPPSIINQHDIYVDPSSQLPVSMSYHVNAYPQDPRLIPIRHAVTIPEEVRFGNYQRVQGCLVPFHIQVYIQNSLLFDITLSSVSFNTKASIPTVN